MYMYIRIRSSLCLCLPPSLTKVTWVLSVLLSWEQLYITSMNVVWASLSIFAISWSLCTMIIVIIVIFHHHFKNYFISSNSHFCAVTRCVTTLQNNHPVSNQPIAKIFFTNHEILTVSSFSTQLRSILADFPAVFFHISHWYLSWNTAGGGDCI